MGPSEGWIPGSNTGIFASDIDNDGDMDLASTSFGDNKVAWYENIDGKGTFGPQQNVTTDANGASNIFASDVDNDGDIDLISTSVNDYKTVWYENIDGKGTFDHK